MRRMSPGSMRAPRDVHMPALSAVMTWIYVVWFCEGNALYKPDIARSGPAALSLLVFPRPQGTKHARKTSFFGLVFVELGHFTYIHFRPEAILPTHTHTFVLRPFYLHQLSGSAEDVARICHGHPGLPEAVKEAALNAGGRAIHI